MSDREEFEKWYSQEGEYGGLPLDRFEKDGDYLDDFVQSMWMAWQAALAQSEQGAEPVALLRREIGESSWFDHTPVRPNTKEAELLKASPIVDYCEVYTHPQPAQQGGVPSRDDLVQCLLATRGQSEGVAADAILWLFSAATPQPEGDGWVSSFERAPTKSDADFSDRVIWWEATDDTLQEFRPVVAHYDPNWWEGGYFEDFSKDIAPSHPFWKPTGLKRPQSPQEGEGNE
ncbi:hypothetical protein [Sinomicrobium sp.]